MAFIFAFALASTLEAQSAPPAVLFVDVDAGPVAGGPGGLGVPIAIYGTGFGAVRGASTVTVGGVEVASYLSWGSGNAHNPTLDRLVVQPGPGTPSGPIVVTVGGLASNADVTFSAIDAHVWYVSATGSDTNDCRESSPCATISHAVSSTVSGPGDTILVRGADHREGEIWVRREYGHGGEPGRQKVVKPYPGDEVTLSNGARPFIVDADYVTVAGFRFANGKGVGVPDAGDVNRRRGDRFIDNIVAGELSWSFIDTHGDDHLLAGNVCEATVSSVGTQGHCYYVSYGENTRIRYNVGSGAPGYGLHVFDQRRATLDFPRVIRNVLIEGNILKESKLRSGLILAMADEGGLGNRIDHVVVRNNIIFAGGCATRYSITEQNALADPRVVENNDLFATNGNPTGLYRDEAANNLTTIMQVNTLGDITVSNNISANPMLTNANKIPANSPCTNAGTATGAPITDFENDMRPQQAKFDIGMDEYKP